MEKMAVKPEDVIHDLIRLKNVCMELDENGKPKDGPTAARCLEFLGRNLGMCSAKPADLGNGITLNVIRYAPIDADYSKVKEDAISADEKPPLLESSKDNR